MKIKIISTIFILFAFFVIGFIKAPQVDSAGTISLTGQFVNYGENPVDVNFHYSYSNSQGLNPTQWWPSPSTDWPITVAAGGTIQQGPKVPILYANPAYPPLIMTWGTNCYDPDVAGSYAGVDAAAVNFVINPPADVTCPAPPTVVNGSCDANNNISLNWTSMVHTDYALRIDDQSDGNGFPYASGCTLTGSQGGDTCLQSTGGNNTSSRIGTAGHTYDVWVATIYNGRWSAETHAPLFSCPIAVPPPPTNLQNPQVCQADNSVTANLSWSASAGATGYKVYEWTSSSTWQLLSDRGNTLSYPWSGRAQGNFYRWGVSAYNSSGATDPSLAQQGFTAITCAPTGTPTPNFTCSNAAGTQATVSWNAVTGATGYHVQVGSLPLITVNGGSTTSTPVSINPGTSYSGWVSAFNSSGDGPQGTFSSQVCYAPKNTSCTVPSTLIGSGTNSLGTPYQYGDVDGDGLISNLDSNKILNYVAAGRTGFTTSQIERADVSDTVSGRQSLSSDVDSTDAMRIGQYLSAGTILPVCGNPTQVCTDPNHTPVGTCDGNTPPQYCKTANSNTVPNCDGSKGSPSCPCPVDQVCKTDGTGTCGTPTPTPTGPPPIPTPTYTISGTIYRDVNNNGVYNASTDTVYTSATPVTVSNGTNSTTTTNGMYALGGFVGNTSYDIRLITPSGYIMSFNGANPNTNPRTVPVTTANVSGINFGIIATPATPTPIPLFIRGTVFSDLNGNDVLNAGEPGVGTGATNIVYLYGPTTTGTTSFTNANIVDQEPSAANGFYNLTPLVNSNHKIGVHNVPSGYTTVGTVYLNSGCINTSRPAGDQTFRCRNLSGFSLNNVNIPLRPLYNISGTIFIDDGAGGGIANNGVRDGTEGVYPSTPVSMSVDGGAYSNRTLASGVYTISNLTGNAAHTLQLATPSGYTITNNSLNPNSNPRSVTITTSDVANVNFGIAPQQQIIGGVYIDNNDDGVNDAGDTLWPGPGTALTITAGSKTAIVDSTGGYWTISGLDPFSTYNVQLAVPFGYIISHGGLSPNTNPRSVSVPIAARVGFGLRAAGNYTISGQAVIDNPTYGTYEPAGDPNLAGTYTVSYSNENGTIFGSRTSSAGGAYPGGSDISVPAGTYSVSYTSSPPSGYVTSFPSTLTHVVTVGPGSSCDEGTSSAYGAICDATGNISGLNFGFKLSGPWIQCSGTDIRFDTGFDNDVPSSAGACGTPDGNTNSFGGTDGTTYACINGIGGSPGIIFSGETPAYFGAGSASFANWKVGSSTYPDFYTPSKGTYTTSYAYVSGRVTQLGIPRTNITSAICGAGGLTDCNLNSMNAGVYDVGNLTISNFNGGAGGIFSSAKKIIILVNGNLLIKSNIIVPIGSTLTFIVSGDITIDRSIGTTWDSAASQIEGFYSADDDFIIDGNPLVCSGTTDRLNMEGSIIVNAGGGADGSDGRFINNRTLCGNNATCPVFTISERPDFVLNAPESIKQIKTIYQEVAP